MRQRKSRLNIVSSRLQLALASGRFAIPRCSSRWPVAASRDPPGQFRCNLSRVTSSQACPANTQPKRSVLVKHDSAGWGTASRMDEACNCVGQWQHVRRVTINDFRKPDFSKTAYMQILTRRPPEGAVQLALACGSVARYHGTVSLHRLEKNGRASSLVPELPGYCWGPENKRDGYRRGLI